MTLKEYIRTKLAPTTKPKAKITTNILENIYKEMMKRGHNRKEIYITINEIVIENVQKLCNDFKKRRDSRK